MTDALRELRCVWSAHYTCQTEDKPEVLKHIHLSLSDVSVVLHTHSDAKCVMHRNTLQDTGPLHNDLSV